jgi:hypothetical protein
MLKKKANMSVVEQTAEPGSDSRKLFDLLNVSTLGIVLICFFLPIVNFQCGPVGARFNGINLAFGTPPRITGAPQEQLSADKWAQEGIPTDPLWGLVPLFALIGAAMLFRSLDDPNRFARVLIIPPAALTLLFLAFLVSGFGIERKLAEDKERSPSQSRLQIGDPRVVEKTGWFYLGLVASISSVGLVAARKTSPSLRAKRQVGAIGARLDLETRLNKLKSMRDTNMITEDEYQKARTTIVNQI